MNDQHDNHSVIVDNRLLGSTISIRFECSNLDPRQETEFSLNSVTEFQPLESKNLTVANQCSRLVSARHFKFL